MFEPKSRYSNPSLKTLSFTRDGKTVAYREPRILPPLDGAVSKEVVSRYGERIDQLSYRVLGDPELYWKLCDANEIMDPLTLKPTWPSKWKMPGKGE